MILIPFLALTGCTKTEGDSCNIADNGDETYSLTCPDGSAATLTSVERLQALEDAVTSLQSEVDSLSEVTADNSGAISDNANAIAENANAIASNTSDIAENADELQDLAGQISTVGPTVEGNYDLENSTDITMLSGVEEITGRLYISGALTSLEGMESLTQVGELQLVSDTLTSAEGLNGLTTVSENLYIYSGASLTSLEGLGDLTSVGGHVYIHDNSNLCQSLVDEFVEGLTVAGVVSTYGNDSGC
jgi:hypothetical protein